MGAEKNVLVDPEPIPAELLATDRQVTASVKRLGAVAVRLGDAFYELEQALQFALNIGLLQRLVSDPEGTAQIIEANNIRAQAVSDFLAKFQELEDAILAARPVVQRMRAVGVS